CDEPVGVHPRRAVHQLLVPPGRRAEWRLVRVRTTVVAAVLDRREHGFLDAWPPDPGHRVVGRRRQLLHYHPQHARPGHDADAHADVRLVSPGDAGAGAAVVPGHHGGADPAHGGPHLRFELLFVHHGRWRPDALAAPVLGVRTPGGVHPDPAGVRHRVRDPAGVLPQAAVRLQRDGVFDGIHRVPWLRRMVAPHVRHRHGTAGRFVLFAGDDVDRDSHRREDLQLDRHDMGRIVAVQDAAVLRAGLHRDVHHGRPFRGDARGATGGPAADGYVLRGGTFPLRLVRRVHLLAHGWGVLLVAQDVREDAG